MQQFFREVWLSFQPKQYYRFVAAGKTSSRWFFLILLGLTYTLVTASIFFWQVGFAAKTTFDQVGHLLSTWPDKVEFVIRNHQLTIQNLPQPYQQTIVGPRGQNWLIRFDVASQTPRLDGAGALITKTGTRLQTSQEARFISWQSVADQTITAEQLKVFAGGTWRLSFWLVGIILFIVLAISLGIFWLIYIWFWAWVLQLPARRMGLRLPKTEMALVMAHICVVPMLIQTVLRLLPGSLTWPFLPTLVTLVFWLAVVKSWPQISGEVDSAGSTEPPINS